MWQIALAQAELSRQVGLEEFRLWVLLDSLDKGGVNLLLVGLALI